jgi:hypothetical protein
MNAATCRGCGKPAPEDDADALSRWAVANQVDSELYCPDCLTPGEADCLSTVADQTAEEQFLLDRLPDAGQGVFVPEQRRPDAQPATMDQPVT